MTTLKYLIQLWSVISLHLITAKEEIGMEVVEGTYKLSIDRKDSKLKDFAEHLGTPSEHIKQIQGHQTVGNIQVKLLDKKTEEIEIAIETLPGKITSRLKPGGKGELSWLDGRKFSVLQVKKFTSYFGAIRGTILKMELDGKSITLFMQFGKIMAELEFFDYINKKNALLKYAKL